MTASEPASRDASLSDVRRTGMQNGSNSQGHREASITTAATVSGLPISRLSFHGLRKLNWAIRNPGRDYASHITATGLGRWIEPGPNMIIVGPNAGGKSTVIDLLRALGDTALWPTLPRENYPGDDFSGFDIQGPGYSLAARFTRDVPHAQDLFELEMMIVIAVRDDVPLLEKVLAPKYYTQGDWENKIRGILHHVVRFPIHYLPATGRYPAEELDDNFLVELLNE